MKHITFPKIGLRNIKTALAVLVCLCLFELLGRNPLYACIAAIVSMQPTVENSIREGANRLIGTAIGGFMGILFLLTKLVYYNIWVYIFLTAIGIVFVIYLNLLLDKPGSVSISCVVFLVILINAEMIENNTVPYSLEYAVNRIIDTAVGIMIGVLVNIVIRKRNTAKAAKVNRSAVDCINIQKSIQDLEAALGDLEEASAIPLPKEMAENNGAVDDIIKEDLAAEERKCQLTVLPEEDLTQEDLTGEPLSQPSQETGSEDHSPKEDG